MRSADVATYKTTGKHRCAQYSPPTATESLATSNAKNRRQALRGTIPTRGLLCLRHAGASIHLTEARFGQPIDLSCYSQYSNIFKGCVQLSYLRAVRSSEFAVSVAQSAKTSMPSGSEDSQSSQLLIAQACFFLAEDGFACPPRRLYIRCSPGPVYPSSPELILDGFGSIESITLPEQPTSFLSTTASRTAGALPRVTKPTHATPSVPGPAVARYAQPIVMIVLRLFCSHGSY
jgi:hypothetical protein